MKGTRPNIPKKFCYLVYCNREPICYAVYDNKPEAVRYAVNLIRWRKERAIKDGHTFDFYHFHPFVGKYGVIKKQADSLFGADQLWMDQCVFACCISIPEEKDKALGDDGCHIRVIRMPLRSKERQRK